MNGVKEFYGIKLKQTSKGVWYCDGLSVEHEDFDHIVTLADGQMYSIETILKKHNDVIDDKKPEKK